MSSDSVRPDPHGPPSDDGLDRILDAGFFAPLGLALQFRSMMPELAETGRRQIEFSRSLGRAVIKTVAERLNGEGPLALPADDVGRLVEVPDYETMTAREVIAFVRKCDQPRLAWIAERESTGKRRVTVLRAVAAARES